MTEEVKTEEVEDQDVELNENEVEEAHDTKNAEQQSLAANDKAEAAGKSAKKRPKDKSNSEPMQKVTPGDPDKHSASSKGAPANGAPFKATEEIEIDGNFSDDLNALVESEATLSDEFKAKTAVIFEAAVKSKIADEINRLETEYTEQLAEEVEKTKSDMVEKVDSYLNYVVEQWVEDNKVAIQSGLRTEIAENFMNKMKDLFTESYVEVPEAKVDLVDELATANEELEEKYNDAVQKAMDMSKQVETYQRNEIIREASKDLAETQVEKLNKLAESVEFESEENFKAKVATLKESYFNQKTAKSPIAENSETDESADDTVEVSPAMESYINALKKIK
tara:strand:+ start:5633 stop:6643 length:1011 start_codon:yes stop_codon:yes gene_type:complete